jgi:hypothetical protein
MMQLHLHVHLHGKRPSDQGWQRLAVLVAIETLILAALPWLGLTPSQPQPMRVQVTLVQPGAAPAPSTRRINPRRPIGHADRVAATIAVDDRPRPRAAFRPIEFLHPFYLDTDTSMAFAATLAGGVALERKGVERPASE